METPSKAEAFTEETTKVAADFVSAVQSTTEVGRALNHPVTGLRAQTLGTIVSLQHTAQHGRDMGIIATIMLLLSRYWIAAGVFAVFAAFFYFQNKRAKKSAGEKSEEVRLATDDYMNAEVRAQMAPAMAAAALRLAQLPRNQVVFVDAEDKEWTANELMTLMFKVGNAGEQTILQFLLSCAVFGFPLGRDDQQPLNELNLERLTALRSTTTWIPRTPPESDELPN